MTPTGMTTMLQCYVLAREMRRAGKRGLTYEQWCLETGRDPTDLPPLNPPLEESLKDVYEDINKKRN
jgi:hypothetical protein